MMIQRHDLLLEFPAHRERIERLRGEDIHFSALFDRYHELDGDIRRVEYNKEIVTDLEVAEMKKRRLYLKDRLLRMIEAPEEERQA